MTKAQQIPASDDAWESGQLGREEQFVKRADDNIEPAIDDALELQLISIRLPKSLIEDFKFIATLSGIGYQPLMRQILTRFADCEKKRILRERAAEIAEKRKKDSEKAQAPEPKQRRAA